MIKKRFFTFGTSHAVAVGAGAAGALLFSLVGQGTWLAIALAYLAPLPIMIAMLGFGRVAGIGATAAAPLIVFLLAAAQRPHEWSSNLDDAGLAALTFLLSLGLPALWLSYLASLSRAKGNLPWSIASAASRTFSREYCPLERIFTYAIAISATLAVGAAFYASFRAGGFEAALDGAIKEATPILESLTANQPMLAGKLDIHAVARWVALAMAPMMAASTLVMLLANLWLAGRVVQVSGRLPRPWPNIARELQLPRIYALVFAAALVAAYFLTRLPGLISAIVATALGMAFALQGLSVIHDLTHGGRFRKPVLIIVYFGLFTLMPWPLLVFCLVGLAEAAFSLRERRDKAVARKL
ncbi:hypothetical protein [Methylocapsa acidiphila]|uniref:hypothetical protein n=1 Tax=Methylocapsa acidiphila TaxID=133552 RepID=UPI0003F8F122|nr:hypothetical protein [Methylocapsa acidiphila]